MLPVPEYQFIQQITTKAHTHTHTITRIGVFAQGQIRCISPNGLQAGHCDAPPPPPILDDRKRISIAFLANSDQYATFTFSSASRKAAELF